MNEISEETKGSCEVKTGSNPERCRKIQKGKTLRADCRRCKNCTGYSCVLYGENPEQAVKACANDLCKNYVT